MGLIALCLEGEAVVDAEGGLCFAEEVGASVLQGSVLGSLEQIVGILAGGFRAVVANSDKHCHFTIRPDIGAQFEGARIGGNISLLQVGH